MTHMHTRAKRASYARGRRERAREAEAKVSPPRSGGCRRPGRTGGVVREPQPSLASAARLTSVRLALHLDMRR